MNKIKLLILLALAAFASLTHAQTANYSPSSFTLRNYPAPWRLQTGHIYVERGLWQAYYLAPPSANQLELSIAGSTIGPYGVDYGNVRYGTIDPTPVNANGALVYTYRIMTEPGSFFVCPSFGLPDVYFRDGSYISHGYGYINNWDIDYKAIYHPAFWFNFNGIGL